MMQELPGVMLAVLFQVAAIATFVYLTFFDGLNYNAWNWVILIPANCFLAEIWPIYWGLIHWI